MDSPIRLGVNIDHVATVRQARLADEPDPVALAKIAEAAGADGITAHLREDRRHIQDRDVERLKGEIGIRLNLEMSIAREIVDIACRVRPACACLVPEKRREVTTEGGLDVAKQFDEVREACLRLADAGVCVSLFIDGVPEQLETAVRTGAKYVELHTGVYANHAGNPAAEAEELATLRKAATLASAFGLGVNAGHGLTYRNVQPVAAIPEIEELNIGHSIVSRALADGMGAAVAEMKRLMHDARKG